MNTYSSQWSLCCHTFKSNIYWATIIQCSVYYVLHISQVVSGIILYERIGSTFAILYSRVTEQTTCREFSSTTVVLRQFTYHNFSLNSFSCLLEVMKVHSVRKSLGDVEALFLCCPSEVSCPGWMCRHGRVQCYKQPVQC